MKTFWNEIQSAQCRIQPQKVDTRIIPMEYRRTGCSQNNDNV